LTAGHQPPRVPRVAFEEIETANLVVKKVNLHPPFRTVEHGLLEPPPKTVVVDNVELDESRRNRLINSNKT